MKRASYIKFLAYKVQFIYTRKLSQFLYKIFITIFTFFAVMQWSFVNLLISLKSTLKFHNVWLTAFYLALNLQAFTMSLNYMRQSRSPKHRKRRKTSLKLPCTGNKRGKKGWLHTRRDRPLNTTLEQRALCISRELFRANSKTRCRNRYRWLQLQSWARQGPGRKEGNDEGKPRRSRNAAPPLCRTARRRRIFCNVDRRTILTTVIPHAEVW